MNRYSDVELKIEEPEAARAEVTASFALAIPRISPSSRGDLSAENRQSSRQIEIVGVPRSGLGGCKLTSGGGISTAAVSTVRESLFE